MLFFLLCYWNTCGYVIHSSSRAAPRLWEHCPCFVTLRGQCSALERLPSAVCLLLSERFLQNNRHRYRYIGEAVCRRHHPIRRVEAATCASCVRVAIGAKKNTLTYGSLIKWIGSAEHLRPSALAAALETVAIANAVAVPANDHCGSSSGGGSRSNCSAGERTSEERRRESSWAAATTTTTSTAAAAAAYSSSAQTAHRPYLAR